MLLITLITLIFSVLTVLLIDYSQIRVTPSRVRFDHNMMNPLLKATKKMLRLRTSIDPVIVK